MDTYMENETVESSNATGPRTPEGIQGDIEENGGSEGAHTPLSQTGLDEQFNEGNPASPAVDYQGSSGANSPVQFQESSDNHQDSPMNRVTHSPSSTGAPEEEPHDDLNNPVSPAHSDADNDENQAVESDSNDDMPSPKKYVMFLYRMLNFTYHLRARRNIVQSDDDDEDNRIAKGSVSPKEVSPNEETSRPTRTVIIDEDEENNQENGNREDVEESDSPTKSSPRKSRVLDSDDEDREEDISKK
ncbi:hypothetical protein Ddc_07220 [Ditylenchus destructor]|nr:hypothetical protein Ddc_07220 [Ditylenchus destructor]